VAWHPLVRSRSYPEVMTAVYRLYAADGRLLYVGIGYDHDARWNAHAKKDWWRDVAHKEVIWFECRLLACFEEARAIRNEYPVHNDAPGLNPFGFVVFRERDRYGREVFPAEPEMVFHKPRQDHIVRQVVEDRAHAAVAHEGEMFGVLVPIDWYRTAAKAMDDPFDF
jgi:hypothetical protein